ncbi:hypothetical protein M3205_09420, partial [Cytobacillus firmus]|uniref:hypothetical protein n=1 Tax=Cytobacillus firmus TaxID=1399 RepID=UPI00203AF193
IPLNWIMFRKHINHLKHCITSILNQKRLPTSTIFIEFVDSLKSLVFMLETFVVKNKKYVSEACRALPLFVIGEFSRLTW